MFALDEGSFGPHLHLSLSVSTVGQKFQFIDLINVVHIGSHVACLSPQGGSCAHQRLSSGAVISALIQEAGFTLLRNGNNNLNFIQIWSMKQDTYLYDLWEHTKMESPIGPGTSNANQKLVLARCCK
ncbi:hypothetical protein K1719_023516 [Acacia pycnantha]|nr:hypothetical protein K1719_023516 [Acacia pycnantha]